MIKRYTTRVQGHAHDYAALKASLVTKDTHAVQPEDMYRYTANALSREAAHAHAIPARDLVCRYANKRHYALLETLGNITCHQAMHPRDIVQPAASFTFAR